MGTRRSRMLWNSFASREDDANSDDSDSSDHARYRAHRSKREPRDARAGASWFPSFFDAHPAKRANLSPRRKSRRRDKNVAAILKQRSSRRWGLTLLATLLLVYAFNFFYHQRRSPFNSDRITSRRGVARDVAYAPKKPAFVPPTISNSRFAPPPPPAPPASNRMHGIEQASRTKGRASVPVYGGRHSHSADARDELIVGGNIGTLSPEAVATHYRRLAKNYLATFAGGIYRQLFFDVLRRRTYSLTPPGANKGVQCILFQIINKRVYMMDPYEVPRNSKPFYRTRINEVIWILSKLAEEGRLRDTEFLMAIHDCVQTVNKPHSYRGAHFQESNPTFTIVSCNFSNNIPFPMWEGVDRDGGFHGWDAYTGTYAADTTPWSDKKPAAVFRGSNRPSMYFRNKEDADSHCDNVGRTRLVYLQRINPGFFDVSVGGRCGGQHHTLQRLTPHEHHQYKYIMYMEGNCGWADRLRHQIFGPSAIIKQETPCRQFFEPLMGPMIHYIPTDFFLADTVQQIHWARNNDQAVQQIVKNANEFASNFLTRRGIETYVEVLLDEYTKLLVEPDIRLENGAVEVTHKRV